MQSSLEARPEWLEAWFALTTGNNHRNVYVLILLNHWLALTMLRATGPRSSWFSKEKINYQDGKQSDEYLFFSYKKVLVVHCG